MNGITNIRATHEGKDYETIYANSGKIYGTIGAKRYTLFECSMEIDIFETITEEMILGNMVPVRKNFVSVTICKGLKAADRISEDTPHQVRVFDLKADIRMPDGSTKKQYIYNAELTEIDDTYSRWMFEASDKQAIRELIELSKQI